MDNQADNLPTSTTVVPVPMNEKLFLRCFLEFCDLPDGGSDGENSELRETVIRAMIDRFLEYHHRFYYPVLFVQKD